MAYAGCIQFAALRKHDPSLRNKCTSIKNRNETPAGFLKDAKPQVLMSRRRTEDIMKRLICVSLFTAATMLAQTNAQPPAQVPGQPGQPSTPGQPPSPSTDPNTPNTPPDAQTKDPNSNGSSSKAKKGNQKKKNGADNPNSTDQTPNR